MCSLLGASEGSNSAIVRDERAVDATHMGEDNDVSSPPKSGILHTYAENAVHRYWLASLKKWGLPISLVPRYQALRGEWLLTCKDLPTKAALPNQHMFDSAFLDKSSEEKAANLGQHQHQHLHQP